MQFDVNKNELYEDFYQEVYLVVMCQEFEISQIESILRLYT